MATIEVYRRIADWKNDALENIHNRSKLPATMEEKQKSRAEQRQEDTLNAERQGVIDAGEESLDDMLNAKSAQETVQCHQKRYWTWGAGLAWYIGMPAIFVSFAAGALICTLS